MPISINASQKKIDFSYPCKNATDCFPYEITIRPGIYFLEVWGAQGGNSTYTSRSIPGGQGGYSSGIYIAKERQNLYLHLGGTQNSTLSISSCYNGGAKGLSKRDGCGGGASDFRTSPGLWNEHFESRIIIAGGGGGSWSDTGQEEVYIGGKGGGLEGKVDSTGRSAIGTQTGCKSIQYGQCGELGIGKGGWFGGGGGGKYGGGNYHDPSEMGSGGGGGSGSIDGVTSYEKWKAVTQTSDHNGPGTASITVIASFPKPASCVVKYYPLVNCNYLLWCIIFYLEDS